MKINFRKINSEKSDPNLNVTQKENKIREMSREDLITGTVEQNVKFH